MKDFDRNLLPKDGVAILTAPGIDGRGPMYLADFRDTRVLIFKPTGNFLGFSETRGILLCKGPLEMQNGIWIGRADEVSIQKYQDIRMCPEMLEYQSV